MCAEAEFIFTIKEDGTGKDFHPLFIAFIVILVVAALIFPIYKLVQVLIRQARAHKPQSKQDAALAHQFVLPKSTPEMQTCIEALKSHERKLLRNREWTERDVIDITHNCNQVLDYLGCRVNEASDPRQVRIMEC